MNARERAVMETLLPAGDHDVLPGALEAGFEEFYARFQATALPSMSLGFKAALWTAAWVAPVLAGRLPPITRLPAAERERALEAMGSSRLYLLRQMMLLLKAVTSFHYGAQAPVRKAIGFPE